MSTDDKWAEWLFQIGYPFDSSWPKCPPPIDHAALARLWNVRDGWGLTDEEAEMCIREAAAGLDREG